MMCDVGGKKVKFLSVQNASAAQSVCLRVKYVINIHCNTLAPTDYLAVKRKPL